MVAGPRQATTHVISASTGVWNPGDTPPTADQTASIQSQIDAVPNGTETNPRIIQFPVPKSQGKYYTQGNLGNNPRGQNGIIRLDNRSHLILEGPSPSNPATFYTNEPAVSYEDGAAPIGNELYSKRRHLWLTGCTNITVRNIRVEGSNYTMGPSLADGTPSFWHAGPDTGAWAWSRGYLGGWELEHAFAVDLGSSRVTFLDCECTDIWGDGLQIGSGNSDVSQIVARRCKLFGNGRQGIAMGRGTSILIDDCDLGDVNLTSRRGGIDVEPEAGWVLEDIVIRNSRIYARQDGLPSLGLGTIRRISITGCTWRISGGMSWGQDLAQMGPRESWTFENNDVGNRTGGNLGLPIECFPIRRLNGVTIKNNTLRISSAQSRIVARFHNCSGSLLVQDNNCMDGCFVDYLGSPVPTLSGNTGGATCSPANEITLRNQ